MGFTIPNAVGLTYPDQAAPDSGDFTIIGAGIAGYSVTSGCAVTASGSSLVLTVASGAVRLGSADVTVAGNTATVATAHATNPRYDLVVVDGTGVASIVTGTAAASPVFPSFNAATQVVLAAVYVPATVTTLSSANLVDKRVTVGSAAGTDDLDSVSSSSAFTVPSTNVWTDIPGMSMTVPAGWPWDCVLFVQFTAARNATADTTNKALQFRAVDQATATAIYGYWIVQDPFSQASATYADLKTSIQENDPLAADTVVKLQGAGANNANITWSTYSATPTVPGVLMKAKRR